MFITVAPSELEAAIKLYTNYEPVLKIVGVDSIAVSYNFHSDEQPQTSFGKLFGKVKQLVEQMSLTFTVDHLEGNTVFLRCNGLVRILAPYIASLSAQGIVEESGDFLIVNVGKVPSLKKFFEAAELRAISFAGGNISVEVSLKA